MKLTAVLNWSGVAALLVAGVCFTGGCKSNEVLAQRSFKAAPPDEAVAGPETTETAGVKESAPTTEAVKGQVAPAETTAKGEAVKHTVAKNESLWKIARKYNISSADLAAYNSLTVKSVLRPGTVINIPPAGYKASAVAAVPETHKKSVAVKKAHKSGASKVAGKAVAASAESVAGEGSYVVKNGDSLWKIAAKHNVRISALAKANNLTEKSVLHVGQKLTIPGKEAVVAKGKTKGKVQAGDAAVTEAGKTEEKAAAGTEDILNQVKDPTAVAPSAAAPAKAEKAGKTDSKAAAVSTEKAAEPATDAATKAAKPAVEGTDTIEVPEETTVDKVAKQFGVKAEDIKRLNPDLSKDGKIKANQVIIIPATR